MGVRQLTALGLNAPIERTLADLYFEDTSKVESFAMHVDVLLQFKGKTGVKEVLKSLDNIANFVLISGADSVFINALGSLYAVRQFFSVLASELKEGNSTTVYQLLVDDGNAKEVALYIGALTKYEGVYALENLIDDINTLALSVTKKTDKAKRDKMLQSVWVLRSLLGKLKTDFQSMAA